jgi:hypothetical protein
MTHLLHLFTNKWINSTRSVNRLVAITCIKHLIPFLQKN